MTTATTTTAAVVRPLIISLFIIISLQTSTTCLAINIGEDAHLMEFKKSLKDSSPLDPTWVAGTNPCDRKKPWLGIDCSDSDYKSVSALLLMHLGLSNTLQGINVHPLAKLESLRFLSLENNSFSGPIPEFNRLSSLKSLFLTRNQFVGEIPQYFFDSMGSLKKLHLSRNNFSGRIPASLAQLDSLIEILLQQNHFSGSIPSFEQKSLQVIDLSYNNLEGEIPQTMSRFSNKSFEGNPNLCGGVINQPCKPPPSATSGTTTKWMILAIVVAVLLVTILFKKKDKSEKFNMIGKEIIAEHDQVVQVHAPSINRRTSSSRRGHHNVSSQGSSPKKGRRRADDLVMINEDKGTFGLPDLMKAAAEVLGNSSLGSTYKATMANGMTVVVKRMRGMNKLSKDVFETEIRRLGRIRHMNILPPLAFHFRKQEKLLVIEFIPKGSLLFLLHGNGMGRGELDWPTRLKIIKGVGRGMGFLHTELEVPHGNLKSSNILLSDNYEPLLTDYALYSLIRTNSQTDVYCLGVVVLEIMTGKFPSQYLNKQNSGTDVVQLVREAISEGKVAELIDPEIAATTSQSSLGEMERMVHIGAACTQTDQEATIQLREAIRSIEEVQI